MTVGRRQEKYNDYMEHLKVYLVNEVHRPDIDNSDKRLKNAVLKANKNNQFKINGV